TTPSDYPLSLHASPPISRPPSRSPLLKLVAAAVLPALIFVWLTTDRMHAGSILAWHLGWTQNIGEFRMPFFRFKAGRTAAATSRSEEHTSELQSHLNLVC